MASSTEAAMASSTEAAIGSLRILKSTEPPVWLAPTQELSQAIRATLKHQFSSLKPHCPKLPFDQLFTEGFDAEQIWQQIDLQSQPLLSSLRREVKKFEKNPEEISWLKEALKAGKKNYVEKNESVQGFDEVEDDADDDDDMDMDMGDDEDIDDEEEEEEEEEEEKKESRSTDEERDSEGEERETEGKEHGGIEDKFLKIKDLQDYLEEDEAREFGLKKRKAKEKKKEEKEEEEEDGDEDEDELGIFDAEDDEDEDKDKLGNARYEDFFSAKKKGLKGKSKLINGSDEDSGLDDEDDVDKLPKRNQKNEGLSSHEKELEKLRSKIELMEKANLDPKVWTMQGEVTAAQRQKNSALEVDLDFEHNARPAPVITEEVTASIEDMIKNRIMEGRFDDVQKALRAPSKAPREIKELDENKSKKGLAEVYEEEYVQKTNPASAPLSFSDEQKNEARMLFKKLCLKLDALSHFHFTPKPVIEDMSVQANVPALAMEEIAPVAVSDAAMLAPEEVFAGKGDIKEETELTKAERKRRRANKKRKFKKAEADKRTAKKARDNTLAD